MAHNTIYADLELGTNLPDGWREAFGQVRRKHEVKDQGLFDSEWRFWLDRNLFGLIGFEIGNQSRSNRELFGIPSYLGGSLPIAR